MSDDDDRRSISNGDRFRFQVRVATGRGKVRFRVRVTTGRGKDGRTAKIKVVFGLGSQRTAKAEADSSDRDRIKVRLADDKGRIRVGFIKILY